MRHGNSAAAGWRLWPAAADSACAAEALSPGPGLRYTGQSLKRAGESLSHGLIVGVLTHSVQNEKNNAQVEDPYGREEALQQDWHR